MQSHVQRASFICGWVLIALGILGFITSPEGMSPNPDTAAQLFRIFPVNIVLSVLHLTWGVFGLAASQWHYSSRNFARITGVVYVILAIWGIVAPTFAGLFPTGGNNIWLDAIIGIALGYFGFTAHEHAVA
ncbi:MAG TPA: DUF4383 domain-containing protein [Gemmatimonadaceae bacterium]